MLQGLVWEYLTRPLRSTSTPVSTRPERGGGAAVDGIVEEIEGCTHNGGLACLFLARRRRVARTPQPLCHWCL